MNACLILCWWYVHRRNLDTRIVWRIGDPQSVLGTLDFIYGTCTALIEHEPASYSLHKYACNGMNIYPHSLKILFVPAPVIRRVVAPSPPIHIFDHAVANADRYRFAVKMIVIKLCHYFYAIGMVWFISTFLIPFLYIQSISCATTGMKPQTRYRYHHSAHYLFYVNLARASCITYQNQFKTPGSCVKHSP